MRPNGWADFDRFGTIKDITELYRLSLVHWPFCNSEETNKRLEAAITILRMDTPLY